MNSLIFSSKGNANKEMNDHINNLFNQARYKQSIGEEVSIEERKEKVNQLLENYFELMEEHANAGYLDRLATYLMYDYVSKKDSHKMKEENAFHTETQEKYRLEKKMVLKGDIYFDISNSKGKVTVPTETNYETVGNSIQTRYLFDSENEDYEKVEEQIALDSLVSQAKLSEQEKKVFQLKYIEDLKNIEISEKLGVSEGTVRQYEKRGLEKLRKLKK